MNILSNLIGNKSTNILELWNCNNLIELANVMQNTLDLFDNDKLNLIESVYISVKKRLDINKVRINNVDFRLEDLNMITKFHETIKAFES